MKRLLKALITLFMCIAPSLVFAANNVLNPDQVSNGTDLSIGFLDDIFGIVDGVLHGSGSQIMGQMFSVFNTGALFIGASLLGYSTIVGTLNTANEGEFLGRKWSSVWIPVRSALGIFLLIPKATGYSTIQIMMMWFIVQGVGLADTILNSAVKYLQTGGVIVRQNQALNALGLSPTMAGVLNSEICMYSIQNALQAGYKASTANASSSSTLPPPPNLLATVVPIAPTATSVNIPGDLSEYPAFQNLSGICGTISWTPPSFMTNPYVQVSDILATQVISIQQIILDLSAPAKAIANVLVPVDPSSSTLAVLPDDSSDMSSITSNPLNSVISQSTFADAMSDFQGLIYPVANSSYSMSRVVASNVLQSKISQGWVLAGSYYWTLVNLNQAAATNISSLVPTPPQLLSIASNLKQGKPGSNISLSQAMPYGNNYAQNIINIFDQSTNSPSYNAVNGTSPYSLINTLKNYATVVSASYGGRDNSASHYNLQQASVGKNILQYVPILGQLIVIGMSFYELAEAQSLGTNPVVTLASIGSASISLAIELWVMTAAFAGIAAGSAGAVPFVTVSSGVVAATMIVTPLVAAISLTLFVAGAIDAFYVPLIPFIIFTFSAIGWFIAVIEAMVAAPLVALGITHPEGHEIVGRADSGLMLLLTVFLTPSMMIIGFISGMILSYVGLWLLNKGFWVFFSWDVMSQYVQGLALVFFIPAILVIYTYLIISIMNQAFSLIHIIPDKVMRWIGAPSGLGIGEQPREALAQSKEGLQSTMSSMGQGGQKGFQEAGSHAGQQAQQRHEREQEAGPSSGTGTRPDSSSGPTATPKTDTMGLSSPTSNGGSPSASPVAGENPSNTPNPLGGNK